MQNYLLFQEYIILFTILVGILGLIIGSFLNVIICRYPQILKQQWHAECEAFLEKKSVDTPAAPSLNLWTPRSHCTHCKKSLKVRHNIPILSYLFLKGKCAYCKKNISSQYPLVEVLTAVCSILIFYLFGFSWQCVAALIFTWSLITLSVIDIHEQILPDTMTIPLIWLGLLLSIFHVFTSPIAAILGASIGYALLWIIAKLYYYIRRREGMGYGDFKMLAVIGAWIGFNAILNTLIIATILGLIVGILQICIKRANLKSALPFGPFLAIGGWITLLFGPITINWIIQQVR